MCLSLKRHHPFPVLLRADNNFFFFSVFFFSGNDVVLLLGEIVWKDDICSRIFQQVACFILRSWMVSRNWSLRWLRAAARGRPSLTVHYLRVLFCFLNIIHSFVRASCWSIQWTIVSVLHWCGTDLFTMNNWLIGLKIDLFCRKLSDRNSLGRSVHSYKFIASRTSLFSS